MTAEQRAITAGEAATPPAACTCPNGDPAATLAIQRQLVERAIERDPEAVGELFERYVDDVYGYLLAWTRDAEVAEQLTERVFRDVFRWLPVMQQGDGELGAWLIAMARDAVAHGPHARPAKVDPTEPAEAVNLLDDPEREVVVFRLLLGHSLLHSAHLAGYRPRVAKALQFIACSTLWRNRVDPAAAEAAVASTAERMAIDPEDSASQQLYYLDPKHDRHRADEFERRLAEPWGAAVVAGGDAQLDNALAIASHLRLAAGKVLGPPDPDFLRRVREELSADAAEEGPEPSSPLPMRVAHKGGLHARATRLRALAGTRRIQLVAGLAALLVAMTAGVVVYANLSGPTSKCGPAGCLASPTTNVGPPAALGGAPTPTEPPPSVAATSTVAGAPSTVAPALTVPPTTTAGGGVVTTGATQTTSRPATTRPPTTRPPTTTSPPTTAPPTTAPPTTAPTTTVAEPPPG
jgi:hypothetical protein